MKKTYTKKQIQEAIAYWENQLKKLNESSDNKVIDYPTPLNSQNIKKYKVTIDNGLGDKMIHTSYGVNDDDAVNNDKLHCRGYGYGWRVLRVDEIPGASISSRVLKRLQNMHDNAYMSSI